MREKKGTRADSIPMIVRLRGTGEARAAEVVSHYVSNPGQIAYGLDQCRGRSP